MSTEIVSKRDLIMSTAKNLFIEKGFRGTTIALIAETAGIAKGSVYSYFSSKMDIVTALILKTDENDQAMVEELLSNDKFKGLALVEQYLIQELQMILNERSFIQAFLSDDMIIMDEEVMEIVQETRLNYHLSQQRILLQAYGKEIDTWLYDLVSTLNGLLNEYIVYLTLDQANFSIERCASLVAFIFDNAAKAMVKEDVTPLLTKDNFPLTQGIDNNHRRKQKALQILEKVKQEAEDMTEQHQKLVLETVNLIAEQLQSNELNSTLLRALIANLRPYTELNNYRRRLADQLDVELI